MYLGDPGRSSVGSYYEIRMNGRKHAEGAAKMVWIDLGSGRSVPLPESVAAPLHALERRRRLLIQSFDGAARSGRRRNLGRRAMTTTACSGSRHGTHRAGDPHRFRPQARATTGSRFADYAALWRWSVANKEAFWCALWDYAGVVGTRGERTLVDGDGHARRALVSRRAPQLRRKPAHPPGGRRRGRCAGLSWRRQAGATRFACRSRRRGVAGGGGAAAQGVGPGDRVAGYLPNMPEAIIAMLGATSLGAIWSSCSPDFGVEGRARPLRPDRAEACSSPSTATGTTARRCRCPTRSRRSSAACRRVVRGRRDPYVGPTVHGAKHAGDDPRRRGLGRLARPACRAADRVRAAAVRPSRSTSCTRRARPACRSASCTARAARCCSISRSIGSTAT